MYSVFSAGHPRGILPPTLKMSGFEDSDLHSRSEPESQLTFQLLRGLFLRAEGETDFWMRYENMLCCVRHHFPL